MLNRDPRLLPLLGLAILSACGGDKKDPPPAINNPPAILAQAFAGNEDAAISGQVAATDAGDTLTFAVVANPMSGALTNFSATGGFTYQPNANFNGADTFSVSVRDSAAQTVTATMTLNVAAVNDAPTATNDVLTLTSAANIDVLANDTDPDGDALTASVIGASFPAGATIGVDRRVSFPVAADFKGVVRINYRVTDAGGATSDATALAFVNVPPLKAVFVGAASGGAAPTSQFVHVNDLVSTARRADGAPTTSPAVNLSVSANGRSLVYEEEISLGGSLRHELFHVNLAQPTQRFTITGEMATGLRANKIVQTANGGRVVYERGNGGTASALFSYDTTTPATLAQRLSPPDTELRYATAPRFNAAETFVYFGGRAPATEDTAAYRTTLSTGVTTRVSHINFQSRSVGVDFVWPKADDSLIIWHQRAPGFFPPPEGHDFTVMTDPANPGSGSLVHMSHPAAISWEIPLISLDGLFVVNVMNGGLSLSRTDTPAAETSLGDSNFSSRFVGDIPDRERVMRSDSLGVLLVSGCATGAWMPVPCDVYEATFADALNPVKVNATNAANNDSMDPAYTADFAAILFRDTDPAGDDTLSVVRRGAFGTQTSVSAAGHEVVRYVLDATGYVALYAASVAGSTDRRLFLSNVNAPGQALEIGVLSSTADPFLLTAR